MNSEKEKFRKKALALRRGQAEAEILEKSGRIERGLFRLPEFRGSSLVMVYVSMKDEVRTDGIITRCLEEGKAVAVPSLGIDRSQITPSVLKEPGKELRKGAYGIREPAPEFIRPVPGSELDLVLVPGLAFDAAGGRIGFGGGYYDRFLGTLAGARVFALAFALQIFEEVPAGAGDFPVEKIITEKGVVDCAGGG